MGMKKMENKETNTKFDHNTNKENIGKKKKRKKAMIIISGILLVILVAGVIVYNLRLSRIDEDIYFTDYTYAKEGSTSTLYCYDASEDRIIEMAEVEGYVYGGAMDVEQQKLIYWQYTDEGRNVELLTYDLESGQREVCFAFDEIEELTGLRVKGVIFDRTDKSIVYLRFSQIADEEEQLFLAKYVLETGEITDMQEIDHKYTRACNGDFYIASTNYMDITTDGNGVLASEKGDFGTNYFINDQNNGSNIMVARMPNAVSKLLSYRQMQFIGESNNCVYVRSVMTIFDHWGDGSIWIKEQGHIAKKIYSFFPNLGTVTILY